MKRKVMTVIFSLLLSLLIAIPSFAITTIEIDDFVFTQTYSGKIVLKEYTGYSMNLYIPKTVLGHQVNEIGDNAFYFEFGIWEVTIPEGVSSIGFWAFHSIITLRKVYVPASVTYIGLSAFDNCPNLVLYGPEGSYVQRYAEQNSIPFVRYPVVIIPTETPGPSPLPTTTFSPAPTVEPTTEPTVIPAPVLKGDASNDGVIDIMDLVSIIDYIVSGTQPGSQNNADANGDDAVDILDLVWIIDRIVGS